VSIFLGRVSYSTYLFHLLVLAALMRFGAALAWPIFLAGYLVITLAVATLMYAGIEAPILAVRPRFVSKS
jgi:peptidoglycan/LPS O-acetylase OafA/YrhL